MLGCSSDDGPDAPCLDADDCAVPCSAFCGDAEVLLAACLAEQCECTCGEVPPPSGDCTEDAFESIQVNVERTDSFDVPSSCPVVTETLLRQDSTISVTNTSTTRGIRLAATLIRVSDQQNLPNGCEEDRLPEQTVEECIESRAAGCEGPLFGTSATAGLVLLPGETTDLVPYVCENQSIFLPPDSGGTCGDALLENVDENWIIQAVYCEPGQSPATFCADVAQTQIRLGEASPSFGSVETDGCM